VANDPHAKIDAKTWEKLREKLPTNARVRVGVLAGAGGDAKASSGITMLELAAIHEFGSPAAGIPERSFIRSTFDREDVRLRLNMMGARLARAIVANKMDWTQALGMLGAWAASQIKSTIKNRLTTGPDPQENRPATIEKKGSDLPLVDTGRLINAITWLVTGGS